LTTESWDWLGLGTCENCVGTCEYELCMISEDVVLNQLFVS
jgi:hypothetical protein